MRLGAMVLAAGLSRRFGDENKLLQPVGDVSMLESVINALCSAEVSNIRVVTGHQSSEIQKELSHFRDLQLIYNPDYRKGMSSSIRKGIDQCEDLDACMICLADMPFLTEEDYRKLMANFYREGAPDCIMIPTFHGRRGHPVIFGKQFFNALSNLPESDQGARQIVRNNPACVKEIDLGTENIFLDVDFRTSFNSDNNGG